MKYKVIGWTYYEDSEILDSGNRIGFAERNAIIDEIRKHQYLFSGWHHQESWEGVVPILNDGRKRCFSQRGWGGVMAEAYGYMGDYDYSSFTFHQSISSDELKFAPDDFYIEDYKFEAVENEEFTIEISEELFEIAKTKNPFYLEDDEKLRYIDENDSIILTCKEEQLKFIVKDVDRNKAEIGLEKQKDLIKGKYKIILTYKPESERELAKVPLIISRSSGINMFEEALKEYNYDIIKEAIDTFGVDFFASEFENEENSVVVSKFIKEYANDNYKASELVKLLEYRYDYKLYEEIATKTLEKNIFIYTEFIKSYIKSKRNMNHHILKFMEAIKGVDNLYSGSISLILKAISLEPNNKEFRKKYYKAIKDTRYEGLSIMAGANLFKALRRKDRVLIELDKYNTYDENTIMKIVKYLTYPNSDILEENFYYRWPEMYPGNKKIIDDGIKAYQEYVNSHFDLESMLEKIILYGISKQCFEMDRYLDGERHAANYVYKMDKMTNFKYDLKTKALDLYAVEYEDFKTEIEHAYK